jgi:N-acyl homoserine lactone hydrolase
MRSKLAILGAAWLALGAMQAPHPAAQSRAPLAVWRLDCGSATVHDYNSFFSDTSAYRPGPKEIVVSCYLIRHGEVWMLWDTGLPDTLIGHPDVNPVITLRVAQTIVAQLARIGVTPEEIAIVGISHDHGDHIGQAAHFPKAKLLIGKADLDAMKAAGGASAPLAPWITGGSPVETPVGDFDVFGDGEVVMLATPGHTPGHHSLLLRLASGPMILSGDLWHFREQMAIDGVPPFNSDRAQTLASMDRIKRLAANINARIVIQHEPGDIARLPPFPNPAR